jgi:hypothetical protein
VGDLCGNAPEGGVSSDKFIDSYDPDAFFFSARKFFNVSERLFPVVAACSKSVILSA